MFDSLAVLLRFLQYKMTNKFDSPLIDLLHTQLHTNIVRTNSAHGEYMKNLHSQQATKKAANLSLNSELLAEAKRLNINLSATMEKALEREVRKKLREEWADNNSEALEACNKLTEKFGLFSDSYRKF